MNPVTALVSARLVIPIALVGFLSTSAAAQPPVWMGAEQELDATQAGLAISPPGASELDRALAARDYPRATRLLAAAIERKPGSRDLLLQIAGIFMLDRKPLNAAIALKKAEALGPLDAPARLQLALAYIALRRGDWARPELQRLALEAPGEVTYLYWLARLDYDEGKYDAARRRLLDVLGKAPDFVRAHDNLGLCYEALHLPDQAVVHYREAVRLNRAAKGPSGWPPLNLGMLLRRRGELDEAERLFREALRYDDRFAQAHYQLGALLEERGDADDAVKELTRAAALDPAYAEPHYALARIYRRAGRGDRADAALARFKELQGPAVNIAAAQAPPEGLAPRKTLEHIARLVEHGDISAASSVIDPALNAHPADPVLHNLAGVVAAHKGLAEAAEAHFEKSIALDRRAPAAYENLARLYQERAGVEPRLRTKALAAYSRLLAVRPDHTEALFQSAFLLALDGRFAASRAAIERLPQEIRRRPQALAVYAAALIGVEDAEAARREVAALAAHPELSEADVLAILPAVPDGRGEDHVRVLLESLEARGLAGARTWRALAAHHSRAGRHVDARRALERTAAAEGATVPLLMELARTSLAMSDRHGALEYLARARAMEPENASVHFFFGMVCVEQDLVREAYESLKKAVELDPENPLVNYAMGAVATHRHEPSESLPYFEKYVRLKPDDPRGYFALGAALVYSNLFDAARAPLLRAAQAPETATGAHYFLGRIARQANDLATARQELHEALRLNPGVADAWAELGLVQTRSGEYADAERSLAKALALAPDHYAASVNLATLYARTKDPRRESQAARVAALIEKREARAQEFLRIIKVVP